MRKIFLDNLPKKKGINSFKGQRVIDWKNSIGINIRFIYDDIEDELKIINYECKKQILIIEYDNKKFNIKTGNFSRCQLGKIVGKYTNKFKVEIGQVYKLNKMHIFDIIYSI